MEQQQRCDGTMDERKQRARESAAPPNIPTAGPPDDGVPAPGGDLTLEEFELDDIEEIESKVFA